VAGLLDFFTGNQNGVGILGLPPAMVNPFQNALQQIANPGLLAQQQASQQFNQMLPGLFGQQEQPPQQAMPQQAQPMSQPSAAPPNFGNAIASIESGGKYDALGPETKGDRAYGKYQVMGKNIGPWTQEVLGRPMTPQEFIANPQAQDAVFQSKFGSYVQRYGPEGAARAWFAGEGGMNNPNAKDILGTTVSSYAQKFNNATQSAMPQMASAGAQVPLGTTTDHGALPQQAQMPPQQAQMPQQQPPMPPQMAQAPQAQRPPALPPAAMNAARAMMIPNISKAQYEFASKIFDRALDDSKLTESQKNYYRAQVDPNFARFNRPPEMKMIKNEFGEEVPHTFDQNTQTLSPLAVPGRDGKATAPMEFVQKIRKEVFDLPAYKNLSAAAPLYKTLLETAGNNTRASDLNMVYALSKMFDPTSVTREGEVIMVRNTAGLPDWLLGTINSLNGGAALEKKTRENIMREAHIRIKSYKDEFDNATSQHKMIADQYQINPRLIIPQFGSFPEWTPKDEAPGDRVKRWMDFGNGVRVNPVPVR
jgi:hypothetical protein